MTEDKWAHLRITRPHLRERRERLKESILKSIEEIRLAREGDGAIPMEERMDMAREFVGERSQEVEAHDDGSVTVHIAPLH